MNQDNPKDGLVKKNNVLSIFNSDLRESARREGKDKCQREMEMLRGKSKGKVAMRAASTSYVQCFPASNFTSQEEDECPVNYSLKYSETESCKYVNKPEPTKKKFKDYTDYAETDLDQPTDFSLKYAEKTYDDENKNMAFTYYNNNKVRFKEYTDYVETDLDQPTDFTLKYRESAEEDIKNEFNFYESEERKPSTAFGARTEETHCERLPGRFPSQDQTPLMFSRSSSLNSLSSFVHITQSIPDDRSSVVSDFSRMTSGIISPSELPDSPTQTAPSSPKRTKPSANFSSKQDFIAKQSVFEDDVATYKQEDTPIEFSRATSLSSLNIDNSKPDLVIKQHSGPSSSDKDDGHNVEDIIRPEHLKQDLMPEKPDHEKGKFELASVLEVDESLFADCISIDIQINCRKPKPSQGRLIMTSEGNAAFRPSNGFTLKPNLRLRFQSDNRKGFSSYELSDDAVHTYHTEGTPANVSHAGSHSDLSALSIASGIPLSGGDDNSDNEAFFPEGGDTICTLKDETLKGSLKVFERGDTCRGVNAGYLREDHQLTEKDDETTSFGIESSPCDFLRTSLGDLTVDVMNPPLSMSRADNCEETPSQILSPLRNVSPQSPNSIIFEEADDAEKGPEELENGFISSESVKEENDAWEESNGAEEQTEDNSSGQEFSNPGNIDLESDLPLTAFEEALLEECIRLGMPQKRKRKENGKPLQETDFKSNEGGKESGEGELNIDLDSNVPLTAFEEALLEECIRLGMPQKRNQNQLQETHFKLNEEGGKDSEEGDLNYSKSIPKDGKCWNGKKCDSQSLCAGAGTPNSVAGENFDFDSSEPLSAFEEDLLEQCIQLGMPQKRNCKTSEINPKQSDEGPGDFDCDSTGLITPLETALVEQCIRLGMSQKKNQKKDGPCEESHKPVSCLTAHLNRLKLSTETEKETLKKCDPCQCGKKHAFRRKNASCRRTKNKPEHFKAESYPS